MHAFDRQTDGETDRRTDGQTDRLDRIPIAIPRLHTMQRGKNVQNFLTKIMTSLHYELSTYFVFILPQFSPHLIGVLDLSTSHLGSAIRRCFVRHGVALCCVAVALCTSSLIRLFCMCAAAVMH